MEGSSASLTEPFQSLRSYSNQVKESKGEGGREGENMRVSVGKIPVLLSGSVRAIADQGGS